VASRGAALRVVEEETAREPGDRAGAGGHRASRDGVGEDGLEGRGPAPGRTVARPSPHRVTIIDATLDCLARHGTLKTTVDDIARRAGVSRATVYRVFPGGRDEILGAVVDTEMARLFSALGVRMGEAGDLGEALVGGIVEASSRIRRHEALAYLVGHEPEMVLGHLAFDESDRLLVTASRFAAPFLARWMSPPEAERVAEWATRIVLSYAVAPSGSVDLTDPDHTTRLVETFVLPGIRALHSAAAGPAIDITPFTQFDPPTDRGSTEHSETEHSKTEHSKTEHSKTEHSKTVRSRAVHSRGDQT
jgi:AcrR family transcriptional regulator